MLSERYKFPRLPLQQGAQGTADRTGAVSKTAERPGNRPPAAPVDRILS